MSGLRLVCLRLLLVAALLAPAGCKTLEVASEIGTAIAVSQGAISEEEASSINRSAKAVARTFEDFTPAQEYYVGRSVGARILLKYQVKDIDSMNRYINSVGQAVALASTRPETFGGYHFLALDSNEINAFAAPGGFVFVTTGMLRLCRTENELAAVLAHEIAHVELKHGLQAIRKSRVTSALTILAAEGARRFGGRELAELTDLFEGSVSDVVLTLTNNGYSRQFEREADRAAARTLVRAGYDPGALLSVLDRMKTRLRPGGPDFAKTHPDPADRIADLAPVIGTPPARPVTAVQRRRFGRAMRGV